MITVYPFGSGSLYTASYAISASAAFTSSKLAYVYTASNAGTVLTPRSGSDAGVNICLITYNQYLYLVNNPSSTEYCDFT